ncbi:DUF2252 domain-containing protein [Chloroflexota bacterium]
MSQDVHQHTEQSRSERRKMGKALRQQVPRSSHADWKPAPDRPDPISLLQEQDKTRLQHLVPIKYGRMLESPFAFLRGSAVVMASDLADTPVTGIRAVLCGDAHLSNFGVFATPERQMVFDINDFDEAYPGPWEWDLKRLAASVVVAGRQNGFGDKANRELAVAAAETYHGAMDKFFQMSTLDVWYYHIDINDVMAVFARTSKKAAKHAQKLVDKARSRTQARTLEKLTHMEDGRRRINSDPPLLVPFRKELFDQYLSAEERDRISEKAFKNNWTQYLDSLPDERRFLLQRFRIIDAALRVGGVGSVGTRVTIALLEGGSDDDAIILQQKEAGASALEPYLPKRKHYIQHAARVVTGQRLMQASSDIFLGWHHSEVTDIEYYWRQLKDMKGSADVSSMDETALKTYVSMCAVCLARAHARTSDAPGIRGYLGGNDAFAKAISDFATAYADQTERDHQALVDAVESGRVEAQTGI